MTVIMCGLKYLQKIKNSKKNTKKQCPPELLINMQKIVIDISFIFQPV